MIQSTQEGYRLLTEGESIFGNGWTAVESFDDLSDGEDYEDELEEVYVTMDLGSGTDNKVLSSEMKYQLIGLDTPLPFLKLGNQVFQGQVTPLIGTDVILGHVRNPDDPQNPSHPPLHTTSHRLTFQAITLTNLSDPDPIPESESTSTSTSKTKSKSNGDDTDNPKSVMKRKFFPQARGKAKSVDRDGSEGSDESDGGDLGGRSRRNGQGTARKGVAGRVVDEQVSNIGTGLPPSAVNTPRSTGREDVGKSAEVEDNERMDVDPPPVLSDTSETNRPSSEQIFTIDTSMFPTTVSNQRAQPAGSFSPQPLQPTTNTQLQLPPLQPIQPITSPHPETPNAEAGPSSGVPDSTTSNQASKDKSKRGRPKGSSNKNVVYVGEPWQFDAAAAQEGVVVNLDPGSELYAAASSTLASSSKGQGVKKLTKAQQERLLRGLPLSGPGSRGGHAGYSRVGRNTSGVGKGKGKGRGGVEGIEGLVGMDISALPSGDGGGVSQGDGGVPGGGEGTRGAHGSSAGVGAPMEGVDTTDVPVVPLSSVEIPPVDSSEMSSHNQEAVSKDV